jgi:hypothetical protein
MFKSEPYCTYTHKFSFLFLAKNNYQALVNNIH